METVDTDRFVAFIQSLKNVKLETLTDHKPFEVEFQAGDLVIVPSSGKPRRERREYIERVLAEFSEKRSFHAKDYHDVSRNSSYLLSLLKRFFESVSSEDQYQNVLRTVAAWSAEQRASLAHALIDSLKPNGHPKPTIEQLVGIGRGAGAPPTDEQVEKWVDEHRTEKYLKG